MFKRRFVVLGSKKFRHELKFYINQFEYESLRKKVKAVLRQDKNSINENGYHIRSLYFDNLYNTDLYEKNYGILKRKKIRIRIYNKADSIIKLERKYRYGEYICKESASIEKEEYEQILNYNYDFLLKKDKAIYKDFYLYLRSEKLSPKVIVDYVREAYVGEESDVRITFDKNLSVGMNSIDIFNENLVTIESLQAPLLIMEVKFNEYLPTYIRKVLALDAHNRSAISKYVICREGRIQFNKY